MERLSKVMDGWDKSKIYDISNELLVLNISRADKTRMILQKLAEYEDLEEQGRMIIFPCNKGDKIYEFYRECVECRLEAGETPEDIISMRRVLHFEYDGDEAYIYASQALPVCLFNNDEPFCIPVSEMGKTIFLSYEEAEAKLKELKEKYKKEISDYEHEIL